MSTTDVAGGDTLSQATPRLSVRRLKGGLFIACGIFAIIVALSTLVTLVWQLVGDGAHRVTWDFFTSFPSSDPEKAGILAAWVGSILVILTTGMLAIPVGVLAGIYLEEYAKPGWFSTAIEIAVSNLAAIPSIIFGLLSLALFVQSLKTGQTAFVAGATLAMLILPIVIITTREAVRGVPREMRDAALALGATKWESTRDHVLPSAMPGVATGVIIGLSRAIGETAPLICIGALTFVAFLPFKSPGQQMSYDVGQLDQLGLATDTSAVETVRLTNGGTVSLPGGRVLEVKPGESVEVPTGSFVETTASSSDVVQSYMPWNWLQAPYTVMPIQMFNWTSRPEQAFREAAAAAGLILLVITLLMNGTAIWLRYRLRKRLRW